MYSHAHENQCAMEVCSPADGLAELSVTFKSVDSLKPYRANARTHSQKQLQQIAASISAFGFVNPVLIDPGNHIVAGHGRVEAAKLLGLKEVPTILIGHLNETQKRAYVLADNRIAQNSSWNPEILRIELQHLSALDLDFNVELTGFDTADIDILIDSGEKTTLPSKDDECPPREDVVVSRLGDLWLLGRHKLYCGDARDRNSYDLLLAGKKADMVFADVPYNLAIDGHVGGKGAIHHRDFVMASGEMSSAEFVAFLDEVFCNLIGATRDGSIHYVCMDWRHIAEMVTAGKRYAAFKNLIVWNKTSAGMGTFYRSQHELIFVFKNGTAAHTNNFGLGAKGRFRTNVWDYAGLNTGGAKRLEELSMHPTVKPVALVADAIRDCSKRNQIVLDPFMGSGTTLIAAEKTGRVCYGMELNSAYVDTAIRRFEAFAGKAAVLSGSGQTFAEVACERLNVPAGTQTSPRVQTMHAGAAP